MSNISNTSGLMRIDTSRINTYLYADQPKTSFFGKVGRFLGKALSVVGPIGAAVVSCLPGGILPAAAIYGASNFAGGLAARATANDAAKMQAWQQENASKPVTIPGFFEQPSVGDIQTNFIVPSNLEGNVNTTLENRGLADSNAVAGFNFY
jgi:hypothetical protein